MPNPVLPLLDELEHQARQRHPEAALRGLKALSSAAEDRDVLRRLRHLAIELLAQLADLRVDRTARLRGIPEMAKAERDICEGALAAVGEARLLAERDVFSEVLISSGYSALHAYIRRPEESMRHGQRGIFISYRRTDTIDAAGRIYDRLRAAVGDDQVFMDVESMPPGVNFRVHVVSMISRCCACLILIGNNWLTCLDTEGRRRLDDESDPVRVEVETALRVKVPTIPLLVGGAQMPSPEQLPQSIAELHYNSGLPIRPNPDFDNDVARLIGRLRLVM